MNKKEIQAIIESYLKAYNNFDVEGMLAHMHPEVVFENIASGKVTLAIKGIQNFRSQAQEAVSYFTEREQKITCLEISEEEAEVLIDYAAILAIDLPNGLKTGDKLVLKGKSVFTFKENQIIRLQDFS
jgi:ketosteroid isomerase-like protein